MNEHAATPAHVARIYSVSPKTVLAWHRSGVIPAEVSVGKIRRFDLAKVAAALAAHSNKESNPLPTI